MKKLILITNYFPYGEDTGEMYLRKEIYVLSKEFDEIQIIACDANSNQKLAVPYVPDNVKIYPLSNNKNKSSRTKYINGTFKRILFNEEIEVKRERKSNSLRENIFLAYFMSKVDDRLKRISMIENISNNSGEDVYIYSYRFFDLAYIAVKLKQRYYPNAICVSRAHRYDLYEEENMFNYLPLRLFLLENLDKVYPCSISGVDYLKNKYDRYLNKISCSYLGSSDFGFENKKNSDKFEIISCSNVIPVKRVDKIANVIRLLNYKCNVHWTHIGNGSDLKEIQKKNSDLIDNGVISFVGSMSHDDVIKQYTMNHFDCFINLSLSEGIPQAIMEANSFGIPSIATNVGGNSEIVKNGVSGILVDINEKDENIADLIQKYINSDENIKYQLRNSTRDFWNKNFNLEVNAKKFIDKLIGIKKYDV